MAGQYHVTVCESGPHAALRMSRPVRHDQFGADLGCGIRELAVLIHDSGLTACGPAATALEEQIDGDADLVKFGVPLELGPRLGPRTGAEVVVVPGSLVARTVHRGGYDDIGPAYRALWEWLRDSGFRSAGPASQVYLIGPDEVTDPRQLLTEIRVPVVPVRTHGARFAAPYEAAVEATRTALRAQGFRILSETDLSAAAPRIEGEPSQGPTLLTVCHEDLASRLLATDSRAALLVSYTVAIRTDGPADTHVTVTDQSAAAAEFPEPAIAEIVGQTHRLLGVALAGLTTDQVEQTTDSIGALSGPAVEQTRRPGRR